MEVILAGSSTAASPVALNAYLPIVAMEAGISIEVRLEQSLNAYAGMWVTWSPNVTDDIVAGNGELLKSEQFMALKVNELSCGHFEKALRPMDVMDSGIISSFMEQPLERK